MKHHVVYVPGLGDQRPYGQSFLLHLWRPFGLTPHYHALGWADGEPFTPKLERLIAKIDSLKSAGNKVSLVGVSAGASAVLTAYSQRLDDVTGVVCISGKIQNPGKINERYFIKNPAFKDSVFGLSKVLESLSPAELGRIMSIHPIHDQTVPISDTIIKGVVENRIFAFGHIQSIFYCLLFEGPAIARFLKKAATRTI